MTLESLITAIGELAINEKLVHFAGAGGSIYEINDLTIRDYPLIYISPTGVHRVEDNITYYALTLFYIDRLTEDNSNGINIHSTGIEVLRNLILKIPDIEGVTDTASDYTVQLFVETERMKDRCNGAFATIEVGAINDIICGY